MARKATHDKPATRANAHGKAAPPTTRVRCPLKKLDDIKAELGRLYREGKSGKRDVGDVSKLANVLQILGRLIEGADLEQRMDELEERQRQDQGAGPRRRSITH
jgi:hypothetical protein